MTGENGCGRIAVHLNSPLEEIMARSGGSGKAATASLVAALVGLWPIYFIAAIWFLGQIGAGGGEFSLAPRDTTRNVTLLVAALGAAVVLDGVALFLAVRVWRRRARGKGRATAAFVLAVVSVVIIAALAAFTLILRSQLGGGAKDLSREQRIAKCRNNQANIATALGPEMWGYDHPDGKPEDLKKLDLSPGGDLVNSDSGVAYINDPSVLICPLDKNNKGPDYAVDVTPEGEIKVRCIYPPGVKEGHNP